MTNKKSFIKLFSTPLGYYCYDVNTSSMLNITGESYNILSGNSTENSIEDFDEIIKYKNNGYQFEDRPDIIEHPYTKLIDGYLKSNVRKVTLQITQNCNLKCKYCNYAYPINGIQRHHTNKSMPYETAIKGIDFLFDHCDNEQEINIGFYGGEPLLEFTKIKSLITYANKKAEKRQKKLSYALTTNGTILNDRIVETVINNDIKIVVSLDGPRDIHNKNRVYQKTGLGSFDDVINNLDNFINKYPALVNQISINSVIDTENDFDCYNDFFMDYRIIKDFRVNASSINKRMLATQFDTKEKYIMKYRYEKFKLFLALLEKVDMKDISLIVKQYRYNMRKGTIRMKNKLKVYLLVLVVILIGGCQTTHNEPIVTSSFLPISIEPIQIEIDLPKINFYTLDNNISIYQYKDKKLEMDVANENWKEFLRDKYGVEITNTNIYTEYNGWIEELNNMTLPTLYKMGYNNGVYFLDYDSFCELANANLLYLNFEPLDAYFENNEELENLPNEYVNLTIDLKGRTWGVAYDYNDYQMPGRHYLNSTLKDIDREAPENIAELYDVCLTLGRKYPEKPVLVSGYNDINILYAFSDILNAYGIYGNRQNDRFESIQYIEATDSYEDLMLSDDLYEALEYIRSLYSINAISRINSYNLEESFLRKDILSYYSSIITDYDGEEDQLCFMPYLLCDDKEPLYKYEKVSKIFLIAKGTEDIKQVLNALTSIILDSSKYIDFRYGEEYKTTVVGGETIFSYNKNQLPYPQVVGIFNTNEGIHFPINNGLSIDAFLELERNINKIADNTKFNNIYKPISLQDYIVTEPSYPSSEAYRWSNQVFTEVFSGLSNSNIALSDLYDEYFIKIKQIGGAEYLEYLNSKAGKTQKYFYD